MQTKSHARLRRSRSNLKTTQALSHISLKILRTCSENHRERAIRTKKLEPFNPSAQEQDRDTYQLIKAQLEHKSRYTQSKLLDELSADRRRLQTENRIREPRCLPAPHARTEPVTKRELPWRGREIWPENLNTTRA
jgi:hypothetical protein